MTEKRVALLGAGSWGTALAIQLARNGSQVGLWGHCAQELAAIVSNGENSRYLPGIPLPAAITIEGDLSALVPSASEIFLVVPSHGFRDTVKALAAAGVTGQPLIWGTKGLEPGSSKLLHQVVAEELGADYPVAIVSGPTFAREVALGLPTAVTVASPNREICEHFARLLHGNSMRVYTSSDLTGIEIGGAVKNVLAIAAGIADGLGFGSNSRAALITRGLVEISRLGVALGAQPETFTGLAGLGDLLLTCTDNQSRNRRTGLGLGKGIPLVQVIDEIGQAVEGVKSAPEIYRLAHSLGVEMPITEQVYRVLYEGLTPQQAVEALLHRNPCSE